MLILFFARANKVKVGFCSETLEEATLIALIKMVCILNNEGVSIMCHSLHVSVEGDTSVLGKELVCWS